MGKLLRISAWLGASWALAFIFLVQAIYDVKRSTPAQFWPWIRIREEQLENLRAYNTENCTMWMSCAFLAFANGVIGVFHRELAAVLLIFFLFPGGFFIAQRYNRILRKYLKANATAPAPERKAAEGGQKGNEDANK